LKTKRNNELNVKLMKQPLGGVSTTRGEFSRLVMRCVKWDGYITRFLGMLGLESLFMKEER
jgi:hypothetical protein